MSAHRLALRMFSDYETNLGAAGSSFTAVIRDRAMLESALALPRQPYYRTTTDKAGALLRSMVKNHPFVDGNKRLGMATTFIFLLLNRQVLMSPNDEMVRFALELAASDPPMPWEDVARWIRLHTLRLGDGKTGKPAVVPPGATKDMLTVATTRVGKVNEVVDELIALGAPFS